GLDLFHPQRDFLFVLVDVQNLDLDLVADGHQFARVVNPLRPAHLANVDQAFNARLELDEGAIAHDVDDFARVPAADGVLGLDVRPRAGRLLFQAECDLLPVLVHGDDVDFQLLVDLDDLAGVGDTAPTHVSDVEQAIDTAQIDESTELGDVLDH